MPCPCSPGDRVSIRIRGFDYRAPGIYFVTIVTHDRAHCLGRICDGRPVPSAIGRVIEAWHGLPIHFDTVWLDEFIVMPNHLHGLIVIAHRPTGPEQVEQFGIPARGSLSTIVRSFKAAATRRVARERLLTPPLWQRGYYERVVRDGDELERVRDYIRDNPRQRQLDRENPVATRKKRKPWEA
jgi:putative transposase